MNKSRTALIAGAFGLVGSHLLTLLLEGDFYTEIISVVRRPGKIIHPKLREIIVDFSDPEQLKISSDDIFCCLGSTLAKAGNRKQFYEVDHDYPLSLAQAALASEATGFYLISAAGANPKSLFFYNRVKGTLEQDIQKIPFETLAIFRPGLLLGERTEKRRGEYLAQKIFRLLEPVIPDKYKGADAAIVAAAMYRHAIEDHSGLQIISNGEIVSAGMRNKGTI